MTSFRLSFVSIVGPIVTLYDRVARPCRSTQVRAP